MSYHYMKDFCCTIYLNKPDLILSQEWAKLFHGGLHHSWPNVNYVNPTMPHVNLYIYLLIGQIWGIVEQKLEKLD